MALQLDIAHFQHMTGADRPLQLEIIGLFRDQVAGWREKLSSTGDWRTAVHTLKGSARGIGLTALADACEAAEADVAALEHLPVALKDALAALDAFEAGCPQT